MIPDQKIAEFEKVNGHCQFDSTDEVHAMTEQLGSPLLTTARDVPRAKTGLVRLIASDLRAKAEWNYGCTSFKCLVKALLTDGTPAMICYRLMQWARRWRLTPLEMIFNRINTVFCSCTIGRGAEFGPAFVLIHSNGIVINGEVRGGSNIKLEHQVTIGAERRQSPVLGDHVFVGAGAKIVGPVRVGDGARIGANAVVVRDVPIHSTAVGIPARVVRQRTPNESSPSVLRGVIEFELPTAQ